MCGYFTYSRFGEVLLFLYLKNPVIARLSIYEIDSFNNTTEYDQWDKTVHSIFVEQVEIAPDRIAVVYDGQKLTYKQLNERANQLAHALLKEGIKTEQLVGILAERSLEMVIGILGILKAGGAYVPIDPEYPEARIQYINRKSEK